MARRKPISTRTRFEIFKRDRFTCQYCGGKPPAVVLHVDHITAVSAGGTNDADNLVTSCKDCNLGKSDVPLDQTRPAPSAASILELREAREQLEAYQVYLLEERKAREAQAEHVMRELERRLGVNRTPKRLLDTVTILKELPYPEALDAIDITETRGHSYSTAWQYFCGVCWTKIKAARKGISTYEQTQSRRRDEAN